MSRTFTANLSSADEHRPDWHDHGACRNYDPELFFPDIGVSGRAAKAVCASCPVLEQCRAEAEAKYEKFGIWGGTSERDRRKIRAGQILPLIPHLPCGHPCTFDNLRLDKSKVGGTLFYTCGACYDAATAKSA